MDKVDTVGKKTLEIFREAESSGPGIGSVRGIWEDDEQYEGYQERSRAK